MYRYSFEPNFRDDFNYPALNRRDLMNLDTIKEKDYPRKKINQINSKRNWSINLYNLDIDKSYPKKTDIYLNKVDFINKIDDIEKARPTKEKILNKPNYVFNVRDIEKAYPKKEIRFQGINYFNKNKNKNKKAENKILTPPYKLENNNYYKDFSFDHNNNNNHHYKEKVIYNYSLNNNRYNDYDNDIKNNLKYYNGFFNKYFNYSNINNNGNNRYNDYKDIDINKNNNRYNDYKEIDINKNNKNHKIMNEELNNNKKNNNINYSYNDMFLYKNNNKKNNLSNSSKNLRTTPLDVHHIIQNQKDYKDTIHDIFNNYPYFVINSKPNNYILNHHHDLILGTPDKNKRLDVILDKSNQILSHDFSSKIFTNENSRRKNNIINTSNSVKINRKIPIEFINQGLEKLYQELDDYKPRTYEQHLDSFTQNY